MTGIKIKCTATAAEKVRMTQRLTRRWASPARRILPLVLMVAGSALLGVGMGWLIDLPWSSALLVSLYGLIGTWLGFALTGLINRPVQMRALMGSALMNHASEIGMGADGITLSARSFAWADVGAVADTAEGVVLLFSDADGLLIPARDLPQGVTATTLIAQINTWKAAQ